MRAIKSNPGERKGCRLHGRGIVVLFVTRICQKIASAQKMYIFPFSQEVPFVRLSFSLEMWPELAFPRKMRVEKNTLAGKANNGSANSDFFDKTLCVSRMFFENSHAQFPRPNERFPMCTGK